MAQNTYKHKTIKTSQRAITVRKDEKAPKFTAALSDSFVAAVVPGNTDAGVVTTSLNAPRLGCSTNLCNTKARRATSTNGAAIQTYKTPILGTNAITDLVVFDIAFSAASTATTIELQVSQLGDQGTNYRAYTNLTGAKIANNIYRYTVDLSQTGINTGTGWNTAGQTVFRVRATNSTLAFSLDLYALHVVDSYDDLVNVEVIDKSCIEAGELDHPQGVEEDDCGGIDWAGNDAPVSIKVTAKRTSKNYLLLDPNVRRTSSLTYNKPYERQETFITTTVNGVNYAAINLSGSNIGVCDRVQVILDECSGGSQQLNFKIIATGFFGQTIPLEYAAIVDPDEQAANAGFLLANVAYVGKVVTVITTTSQVATGWDFKNDKFNVYYDVFLDDEWEDGSKRLVVGKNMVHEGGNFLKLANSANQTFELTFKTDQKNVEIIDVPV